MKKISSKNNVLILLLAIALFSLIACQPAQQKQCTTDDDCVPTACCHAQDAVNKAYAPDCKGVVCTMQCEPETLDCGQGEIKCVNNQCTAVINSPLEQKT